jgi:predicted amidohydrolase YtcJ
MATLITNSTAYVNGNVYTINDAQPHAEAFIVASNGTFSHVGTTSAIRELAKEHGLPTYDFDNKFIMPGIHDAHVHLLFAGYALCNEPDIGLTNKLDDIIPGLHSKCCSCAYTNVYGDWLIVNGFNIENFDRAALDEAYPSVPVVIRGAAGHAIYANTQALIRAGIDPNHQADALPAHYKRREDGSLTGECHETAMDSIVLAIPFPKVGHAKRCLKQAIAALHQAGVTSIQEAASNTVMVEALTELDREGSLKLDIATHIVHTPQWIGWESAESLRELLDRAPDMKTDHVDTRFMKVILDGVPLPPLFSQSELGEDGKADLSKLTHQNLASVIEEFDQRGVTCKVHCGGKGSVRTTLDAIETARRKNLPGPHHEIAHCNGVHEGRC